VCEGVCVRESARAKEADNCFKTEGICYYAYIHTYIHIYMFLYCIYIYI
jgi:hypothetical protein